MRQRLGASTRNSFAQILEKAKGVRPRKKALKGPASRAEMGSGAVWWRGGRSRRGLASRREGPSTDAAQGSGRTRPGPMHSNNKGCSDRADRAGGGSASTAVDLRAKRRRNPYAERVQPCDRPTPTSSRCRTAADPRDGSPRPPPTFPDPSRASGKDGRFGHLTRPAITKRGVEKGWQFATGKRPRSHAEEKKREIRPKRCSAPGKYETKNRKGGGGGLS